MKIEIKIKTTGEIKELNELRVIDIYGFEEKRYYLQDDIKDYRLEHEVEAV